MIHKISKLVIKSDRVAAMKLVVFSFFIATLELIGIGVIMPFISVANNFELIHSNEYAEYIYTSLNFNNDINFVLSFGMVLVVFYIFRGGVNLIYILNLSRFVRGCYYNISHNLFLNYLGRSYKLFLNKNNSDLTKALINEAHGVTSLLSSSIILLSEVVTILFIYLFMLYVDYRVTLLLTLMLGVSIACLKILVSNKVKNAGQVRESSQKKLYNSIHSTLSNFKVIKIRSNNNQIVKRFSSANKEFMSSQINYDFYLGMPRLILESLSFSIIITIVLYLLYINNEDISSNMAIISMFVLGLYRLMPSVNKIFTAYNNFLYHYKSLDVVYEDMIHITENLGNKNISFKNNIELKKIGFSYNKDSQTLNNITISIARGEKVAFTGLSGSGKTTLVDIIMGLHKPNSGQIYIDGELLSDNNLNKWREKIGYIPQDIFLFDGTVAENVAFGKDMSDKKVKESLSQANILDFLELNHNGIHTHVGDGGCKLSGGQKQRIAIAKAIYGDPEILVLDEATSSLDHETEVKVMEEIYEICRNKTLIVIAHRMNTIMKCDTVYNLENGRVVEHEVN